MNFFWNVNATISLVIILAPHCVSLNSIPKVLRMYKLMPLLIIFLAPSFAIFAPIRLMRDPLTTL